jgi:3-deoxy-7-phosphoheptulonate synthase
MTAHIDDTRIRGTRPLLPPAILLEEIPAGPEVAETVSRARRAIEAILAGRDDRLLVIAGPCSIHDPAAALDYCEKLSQSAARHAADLLIVMRVYFEKPRTVVGWKGLINDPFMDNSFEINRGLRMARELLLKIAESGMPAATEFLDTITPQFIADLVSWAAIGARTTESQVHRELASGLSTPVGFKNGTGGNVKLAVDAVRSARSPHWFPSVTKQGVAAIFSTAGNEHCHIILRGGSRTGPNYDAKSVRDAVLLLEEAKLPPFLMVDCSHANSAKDFRKQREVAADLASQISGGSRAVAGVMLESHLVEGRQEAEAGKPLIYGQSVTDACLGYPATEEIFALLAEAVRHRRQKAAGS